MSTAHCLACNTPFEIFPEDLAFYSRVSPSIKGEQFLFPPPNRCPDCRKRLRMAFQNQMQLYQRMSSLSGKRIISIYHEQAPFPVYDHDEWWSESWDGRDYGLEFSTERPFFEQFALLLNTVPRPKRRDSWTPNDLLFLSPTNSSCYITRNAASE